MSKQVLKILDQRRHSCYDDVKERENKRSDMADELTALMCYREVRAFVHGNGVFSHPGEVVEYLKGDYSQHTILKAIEQYKNEQK